MSTEFAGSALKLQFGGTDLATAYRSFEPEESVNVVDASHGSDTGRRKIVTLRDGRVTVEMVDLNDGSTIWNAVVPGTGGTLIWGEQGTAAGRPKHSVYAVVASRRRSVPYDGVVTIRVEFEFNDQAAVVDSSWA